VADGVGSWREYGVNPREFAHRLMEECRNVVEELAAGGPKQDSHKFRTQVIEPATVMASAFNRVKQEGIIGSSTACVGLFDGIRHQLHFSNLGDSGIIVLRHIDSDVAGSLKRDRKKSRVERKSDLQVTFVSQQQLRSFNHPYQLGWTGEDIPESEITSFKTAKDSCTSSIHLRRGDIVIVATDGLFDNVDVDEICEIALDWEQRHGFVRGGDVVFRERRWAMGNSLTALSAEVVSELAASLCQRARENSVNAEIDSPFAILAKENDIMWSGGMPDDCTVLVLHVVGRDPNDLLDTPNI
jgi:protein phosphatase PTC7